MTVKTKTRTRAREDFQFLSDQSGRYLLLARLSRYAKRYSALSLGKVRKIKKNIIA